jgi:RNA polymerase sigma-70 factor (ECF subfamily)
MKCLKKMRAWVAEFARILVGEAPTTIHLPHCCARSISRAMSTASTSADGDAVPLSGSDVPTLDPDAALMLEVAADSEAAFTSLVRKHQNSLVNFFARLGVSADCEDLVQETFVRLYRARRQYRPAARFTTYLYTLARNVWADRGRKIVRFERLSAGLQNEAEVHGDVASAATGESLDLEAALDQLSPKLREVIVLNIYQGLRYQEIADVLGIPLGTVKSRINLALAALREILHAD